MATVDGLTRFDGARFTVFNKSNSPGIVNNRFVSLFETAGGDLWAGTEKSGAARFSGGQFENFGAGDAGIPRSVSWIESDTSGDGAIFHGPNETIHFQDGKFSPFDKRLNFPLPRAARSSNIKIVCRFNIENKFSECFVNGQPKRWIVERTFGWLIWNRRLVKDYEENTEVSKAFIQLAMIRLMLKQLT